MRTASDALTGTPLNDRSIRDRQAHTALMAILAVALVLRVAYMIFQSRMAIPVHHPDSLLYDAIARNLLDGKGYVGRNYLIVKDGMQTAFYGPVYPIFLAALYGAFGYAYKFVQIAQILVSVATCWLVYTTGKMLYGRTAGLLAAAMFALYPELVAYPSAILSETLYIFLEVALVYMLAKALSEEEPKTSMFAATGCVFALAFLCRQVVAVVPIFLIPFVYMRYRGRGSKWLSVRIAAFAFAAIVVIAPWSVRNYFDMGTVSPATSTGGVTFWWGNKAERHGKDLPQALAVIRRANPGLGELKMNSLLYGEGFKELSMLNPAGLGELVWSKWRKMWMPYLFNANSPTPAVVIQYVLIYATLLLGLIGSIYQFKRSPGTMAIAIVVVSGIIMHLATIGNSRYSLPFMPLLMTTAAPMLVLIAGRLRARKGRPLASGKAAS
jgi:4-amino-4-deoxy-L-arabinose transferase-like glycosyltransferase